MKTDAAFLKNLSERTDTPLPRLQCTFENGISYQQPEYVPGVAVDELNEAKKQVVKDELH